MARLASFPYARSNQPSANATTKRQTIPDGTPTLIEVPDDGRAYIMLKVLTGKIRYFYKSTDYAEGMPIDDSENVTTINRNAFYVQSESGNSEIVWDKGTA